VQLHNSAEDIWAQDFFETGYMSMPAPDGGQHAIRTAYRSANVYQAGAYPLRSAGSVVFTQFRGPDVAGIQAFDVAHPRSSDSLNSYGNLETIPPHTSDAGTFPLGRMIRGSIPSFAPDPVMAKLLESQGQQPPVYIDTSWLLVGHVDETISFLKASTPRGWVMLVNDPTLARQMLMDAQDAGYGDTQMFIGKSWYDDMGNPTPAAVSINDTLNDTDVMTVSATAAAAIDAQLTVIKAATGITDAEIIHIPFLDHTEFGAAIAYQVGTVNSFVVGLHDIVVPSTFGPLINGVDIFQVQLEAQLAPLGYTVHWVDDWALYHTDEGEIHCGTNAARKIPDVKWWEAGR
jgi:protein-arginine deiminase